MKAISLWQPWASLVAIEAKKIETRSWATSYRGELAIQASAKLGCDAKIRCWAPPFIDHLFKAGLIDSTWVNPYNLPLGAIVAVCQLTDCLKIEEDGLYEIKEASPKADVLLLKMPLPDEPELSFGDYTPGRYAWILSDVMQIEPIPIKGSQGLWNVPVDVEAIINNSYSEV